MGDLNGDSVLDIVTATLYGRGVCASGPGDGTFQNPVTTYNRGHWFLHDFVELGDLNGDGVLDLVTASTNIDNGGGSASVLLGRGDGTFADRVDYLGFGARNSLALGDLDNDGVLDLVMADEERALVSVRLGRGDGTFATRVNYATGPSPSFVTLGDLNGDGALDLVTTTSVLLGRGDGTFGAPVDYAATGSSTTLGDLNGDGALDLVTYHVSIRWAG